MALTTTDLLAEKRAELAAAEQLVATAQAEVEAARVEDGLDSTRGTRSTLNRAMRVRAEAQERVENLRAAIRALEPRAEAERVDGVRAEIDAYRPRAAELSAAAEDAASRIVAAIDSIIAIEGELDELELEATRVNSQIRMVGARLGRPAALPVAVVRRLDNVRWRSIRAEAARLTGGSR